MPQDEIHRRSPGVVHRSVLDDVAAMERHHILRATQQSQHSEINRPGRNVVQMRQIEPVGADEDRELQAVEDEEDENADEPGDNA